MLIVAVVIIRGRWFVGWCWAVFAVRGVVLVVGRCGRRWGGVGRCGRSWGGAGPLSVFVGWCWAWVLVADAGGGDGPSSWWVVVSPRSHSC